MSTIFKTFEEARDYIKKDPVGKSWVRLDDGSGFEVKNKKRDTLVANEERDSGDNEVLSVAELKKQIGFNKIKSNYRKKPRHTNKPLYSSANAIKKKAQTTEEAIMESRAKKAVNKAARGGASTKQKSSVRSRRPKDSNDFEKRYIDEPWGTRDDWKRMSGRQSAINKSNKS